MMFLLQGFSRPHDLTVDSVHNAVYVTEIGPNRIWKFVPIPSKHGLGVMMCVWIPQRCV